MSGLIAGGPIFVSLQHHERLGGHTIQKHVGKTDAWLAQRLLSDPTISSASTFPDLVMAENAVNGTIHAHLSAFSLWFNSSRLQDSYDYQFAIPVGTVMSRSPWPNPIKPLPAIKVRVIVRKLQHAADPFYVCSGFPIL